MISPVLTTKNSMERLRGRIREFKETAHNFTEVLRSPLLGFAVVLDIKQEELYPSQTRIIYFSGSYALQNGIEIPMIDWTITDSEAIKRQNLKPLDLVRISAWNVKRISSFTDLQKLLETKDTNSTGEIPDASVSRHPFE